MPAIPFAAPSLTQVITIQNALTPLHWGMRRSPEWKQGLKMADSALTDGPPVAQSTLATRELGNLGYVFRYKSDPALFARMIVAKDAAIGPSFELTNKDEKKWLKTLPLVIAAHMPGECQTVSTRLYLKANALMPVAGRDDEFYAVEDLTRRSEAFRQVSLLLWAGLGVHIK
jgi:hypothetical protein